MSLKHITGIFWTPEVAPGHWARENADVSSMLASVLGDWQAASALGAALPDGQPVSAAGVLALLRVPDTRPRGLLAGAAFATAFTFRCVSASAKAQVLASRLRRHATSATS